MASSGIEPLTRGFSVPCSTNWATKPYIKNIALVGATLGAYAAVELLTPNVENTTTNDETNKEENEEELTLEEDITPVEEILPEDPTPAEQKEETELDEPTLEEIELEQEIEELQEEIHKTRDILKWALFVIHHL